VFEHILGATVKPGVSSKCRHPYPVDLHSLHIATRALAFSDFYEAPVTLAHRHPNFRAPLDLPTRCEYRLRNTRNAACDEPLAQETTVGVAAAM
jgi:hypothetical protein